MASVRNVGEFRALMCKRRSTAASLHDELDMGTNLRAGLCHPQRGILNDALLPSLPS
jgi:hypothetical protein